jgi:SAM-dependent methyltransferase
MLNRLIERTNIRVPPRAGKSTSRTVLFAIKTAVLSPLFAVAASFKPVPGLWFRARCFGLGLRALFSPNRRLPLTTIFDLLFLPMDSTRYFEFDFAWPTLVACPGGRYLDVSSPRLLPMTLIDRRADLDADLLNPDPKDLAHTSRLVSMLAVADRCRLHNKVISDAHFDAGTFDVITSISVLEHIPEDVDALRRIWSFLKPGGTLVLTVPCMARASEQFIDRNEWGVLEEDVNGQVFWQRYYDQTLLEQRIFNITGLPHRMSVFGETAAGTFLANAASKRADPYYPHWREPYMVACDYRYFGTVDELPGEGVIGMVFVKPS